MNKFNVGDKVIINFNVWLSDTTYPHPLKHIQERDGYLKIITIDYCVFHCGGRCNRIIYRFEGDDKSFTNNINGWCHLNSEQVMEKIGLNVSKPKQFKLHE